MTGPPVPLRFCRDVTCPACGWAETYTEPTPDLDGLAAIGCSKCGWRVEADEQAAKAEAAEQVNWLGRMMAGCGRQVAENWAQIWGDETLAPIVVALAGVLDALLEGDDPGRAGVVRWALDQLNEAARVLPSVDADIAGPHRGGGS